MGTVENGHLIQIVESIRLNAKLLENNMAPLSDYLSKHGIN